MKYFFIVVGLLLTTAGFSQIQDDFTDGDFTSNPQWYGTTANYNINSSQQLQLNQTIAGTSFLHTPLIDTDFDDKEWNVWVRQTFAGSGTNYGRIYLIANGNDLSANPEGVYLQLGEANATDAIRLVQRLNGTTTILCSTADGSIANSFAARVKVRRNSNGLWELFADLTGGQDLNLISSASEVGLPIGSNFGYLNVYTATNSNRFYLDDVYYGDWIVDLTPPAIQNTTVLSNQSIRITFTEPVTNEVLSFPRWSFNPSIAIESINWLSSANLAVDIQFSTPLVNGQTYAYEVTNAEDLSGNIANPLTGDFVYLVSESALVGDVIINEFFPDPSPVVGLPEYEFVEIYNRSNKIFNLQGWKIADNSTQGTISGSHWLLPGQYAVLTANANVVHYPGSVGVTTWPSLNNSADDVAIISGEGLELERLTFSLDWYHDVTKQEGGWTLERINPLTDCSDYNNWKASIDGIGGTPGLLNSVYNINPDVVGPELEDIRLSNDTLYISFSEAVNMDLFEANAIVFSPNITISNFIVPSGLRSHFAIVMDAIPLNQFYTISFPDLLDCSGNVSVGLQGQFIKRVSEIAVAGDIIINEFMADPTPVVGLPEVEFIELFNRSTKVFNLRGWKIGDNSTYGTIGDFWLMPNEYVVLTANANVSVFIGNVVGVTSFPSLGNAADEIRLLSLEGQLVDQLSYTDAWYKDETKKNGGWTLERINVDLVCSSEQNWRASTNIDGGTPAMQNSIFSLDPDLRPVGIQQFYLEGDSLFIILDEWVNASDLVSSTTQVTPNVAVSGFYPSSGITNKFQFIFADLRPNTLYLFNWGNVQDCAGNYADLLVEFGVPSLAIKGDVVINEVLFDPETGGSDFIELYNKSDKWIDLKGWKLTKYSSNVIREVNEHYLLEPNDYVVITADSNYVRNNFPFTVAGKFIQMAIPSLNADSSTLYIYSKSNDIDVLMDQFSYSNKWHFTLLESKKGKSLERLSADLPTQDRNNWHTAAESMGWGTPGMVNSQFSAAEFNGSINFTTDVISPDNDGFEDFLQINYQMESPGMIATFRIYDDVGRVVKLLVNNELLGAKGSIMWDGVRDDGLKAKIGIYILVVEAYNLEGDPFKAKKAFTVSGKL